jgi:signal transduction histidine kinase
MSVLEEMVEVTGRVAQRPPRRAARAGSSRGESRRPSGFPSRLALIRAIHDGPVQDLSGIALALDALADHHGPGVRGCADIVRYVLADLRAVLDGATDELKPPDPALRRLPVRLEPVGEPDHAAEIEMDLGVVEHLDGDLKSAVAGFVAEGFRNARKHADPSFIAVKATLDSGCLRVVVENDGVRGTARDPGLGLRLLELDADQLGGSISARAMEDTWKLTLTLPVVTTS